MYQYFKYSNSLLFPFDRCRRVASGLLISEVQAFLQKPSSIIIILIFVNRTLRRIKSSRLIGLVLHAVTLIFFKEHPSHSALCCDISVELSPFAVKSMFWLRYGPITSQEITYPDLVEARIVSVIMNVALRPWVGRSRVCFSFFTKIILEYFIKSMIYQILKSFKIIAYFIPRWSEDLSFDSKIQKYSLINI